MFSDLFGVKNDAKKGDTLCNFEVFVLIVGCWGLLVFALFPPRAAAVSPGGTYNQARAYKNLLKSRFQVFRIKL